MNLLAFDTSTEYLSLALLCQGATLSRSWSAQQQHAELALPQAQLLLSEAGLTWSQLDGIAVSIGPGSFTGLRIGCGIVQGLAFGLDIPTVGVNTLAALAAGSPHPRVVTALDARMGELYMAAFARNADGDWDTVIDSLVGTADQLPELAGDDWFGLGSGFAVAGDALRQRLEARLRDCDTTAYPQAAGVLALAAPRFAAGLGQPADRLELVYIRDRVALKTSERPVKPL